MTNTTNESSRNSTSPQDYEERAHLLADRSCLRHDDRPSRGTDLHRPAQLRRSAADGANPTASLLLGSGGTLFGTTQFGGPGDCALGCGVVFRLGKKGKETILHTFDGSSADGADSPVWPGARFGWKYVRHDRWRWQQQRGHGIRD